MEATAGASPASTGAGTGSAQSGSPSSQASASNSAGQTSTTRRPSDAGGAPPSSDIDNREQRETRQQAGRNEAGQFTSHQKQDKQEEKPADDDPELDFGERGKFKRSKVLEDFNRMRQSQAAEAKRAAEYQRRAEAAEARAKQLESLGIDPVEFDKDPRAAFQKAAHEQLRRQLEEAQMDPRELEMKRREETLQEREARLKQEEEQRAQEQHNAAVAAKADEFATSIHEALEQSNLPRNPETVARMASYMLAAARNGAQIPKDKLAALVAKRIGDERSFHVAALKGDPEKLIGEVSGYLSGVKLDGAQIMKLIGAENTEALRKHLLSEAQSKFNPKPQPQRAATPRVPTNPKHPNGYFTWDELQELERKGQL